jgi:hypothetical protein
MSTVILTPTSILMNMLTRMNTQILKIMIIATHTVLMITSIRGMPRSLISMLSGANGVMGRKSHRIQATFENYHFATPADFGDQ